MPDNINNLQIKSLRQIRDVYRAIYEYEINFEQLHDLGLNEGMLLCTLTSQKYSSNELSASLGLSKSNTSKIIKSVEKKGLIKRIIGEDDKRQMYFTLTEIGLDKLNSIKCERIDMPELLIPIIK